MKPNYRKYIQTMLITTASISFTKSFIKFQILIKANAVILARKKEPSAPMNFLVLFHCFLPGRRLYMQQ